MLSKLNAIIFTLACNIIGQTLQRTKTIFRNSAAEYQNDALAPLIRSCGRERKMPQPTSLSVFFFCFLCLAGLKSVRSQLPASTSSSNTTVRNTSAWNSSVRNGTIASSQPILPHPLRLESDDEFYLHQDSILANAEESASVAEALQPEALGNCLETCFRTEKKKGVSCAFVTSAGSLLSTNLGKMIDGYDVVMRTYWTPIKGYESHVGSRTDVRPAWANDLDRTSPETYGIDGSERALVFARFLRVATGRQTCVNESDANRECEDILKAYRKKFPTHNALSSSCIMSGFAALYDMTNLNGMLNLYPGVHYTPTTGFSCINFLANVCDTVTVFGTSLSDSLDKKAGEAGYGYHYYPNEGASASPKRPSSRRRLQDGGRFEMYWHNFTEERDYYLKRSTCACRAGYTGVIFLDASKLRPLPPSLEILKHDEATKISSPGGAEAVKRLFQQFKNLT